MGSRTIGDKGRGYMSPRAPLGCVGLRCRSDPPGAYPGGGGRGPWPPSTKTYTGRPKLKP